MDVLPRATARPALEPTGRCPSNRLRVGSRPALSVVIVNYRNWGETAQLVAQLRRSSALRRGAAEIVVVDNGSPTHPLIPTLRRMSGVSLRRWRGNHGFARAVNEGCRLSQGDWVLLLNPDVTLQPDFLEHVLTRATGFDPRVGIVGFGLDNSDGSPQFSTGCFPTLFSTLSRLLLPRHLRKYTAPAARTLSRVDWVTGCCMLIRRECWLDLGGFDPAFFLYYEDVDLCRRAAEAGWVVAHDPSARVVHHHPLHTRNVPPHLRLITRHALLTYAGKHWAGWHQAILGGVIRLESLGRRLWSWATGNTEAARTFVRMGRMAGDLVASQPERARSRLLREVRHQENQRVASAVDRHPVPQPPGPARALSALRVLAQAAGDGSSGG